MQGVRRRRGGQSSGRCVRYFAAIKSGSASSTLTLRLRGGFFGFVSTTFGLTLALSKIGRRYWPVAEIGCSAIASGAPSAMIFPR